MADLLPFCVNASECRLLATARFPASERPVAFAASVREIVLVSTRTYATAELVLLSSIRKATNI